MPKRKPALRRTVHAPLSLARRLARDLLAWYDAEKRDLPWRRTRDPYAILVSEFMLQQTQVATVVPYYERFLERFPTVRALAESSEQEVLRHWAGLGYYGRARNLHAAARRIVAVCEGEVPRRVSDLLFLPGVGRYIAGAVASIAFGVAAPAVDSNVVRVICRLFALDENPASARARRGLEELVSRLIPASRPGDFNQALMEMGARVCAPASPRCGECPLRALCEGTRRGNPRAYPAPPRRPAMEAVEEASAVVRADGKYLVVCQRTKSGRYRNLWQFPHVEVTGEEAASRALQRYLRETLHLSVRVVEEWAEVRHQVTHHRIRKRVYLCALARRPRAGRRLPKGLSDDTARWATVEEIGSLPLGAPDRRILDLIAEGEDWGPV